ncbi:hypothetical protein BPUN_3567 [Candidatus Paraburkholderia kirkii]|nr:hypothetical protein BPUN_3567 [Candidatus Paraburkholderia kirkii]
MWNCPLPLLRLVDGVHNAKIVLHQCLPLLRHDATAWCAMHARSARRQPKEAGMTQPNDRAHESEDVARIRALIEAWRQTVLAKDAAALVSHYAADVVVFDVVPPASLRGVERYRANWQRWFDSMKGPLVLEMREVEVAASGDLAYAHSVNRVAVGERKISCAPPCASGRSEATGVSCTNTHRCHSSWIWTRTRSHNSRSRHASATLSVFRRPLRRGGHVLSREPGRASGHDDALQNPEADKQGGSEAASGCGMPPGSEEKIMHTAFTIGDSMLMASDGMCSGKPDFKGVSLSLTADDEQQAEKILQRARERRPGTDADDADLLRQALRHGDRQIRCRLDSARRTREQARLMACEASGWNAACVPFHRIIRKEKRHEQLRRTFAGRPHRAVQGSSATVAGTAGRVHGPARHGA